MHLLQTYSLNCGLKIDRPHVYEHYSSVPFEKFISFNKKIYPYFSEVIDLIKPELEKRGIGILQLNATKETAETEVAIYNHLSFGQWAYIIQRSLLHFGEDEFLFDLAAHYDIPRVIMFGNTYPNTTKPMWGSKEKEKILFSTGKFPKPSLSADPSQSFIRDIKPEQIAQAVMDLLGIPWKAPFETVFAGTTYRPQHDIIELTPGEKNVFDINGRIATLAVRADYRFNEQFIGDVISRNRVSLVTAQPINLQLLQTYKNNIQELIYIVDKDGDIKFAKAISSLNIPYILMTYNNTQEIKEKFFEVSPVHQQTISKFEDVPELKNGLKGLFYKSSKRLRAGENEYKGLFDMQNNRTTKPNELSPCPENPTEDFMKELEFYYIVKPS